MLVGLTVGGIESQLLKILPRLQGREYGCMLCSLKGDGPLAEEFRGLSLRIISLRGCGRWDARVVGRLYRVLKAEKIDLLQCYTTRANWAGALAGRLARVPVVILSDREIRTWMRPHHKWMDRLFFGMASGMVVPSHAIKAFDVYQLGLDGDRIWVIPNGVDWHSFPWREPRERIRQEMGLDPAVQWVGYVGRLDDSVKGISYLLEAAALLKRRGGGLGLVIVGEGPSEASLKDRAHRLGLRESVRYLGGRRDVPRILRALDLLVLPSLREGCPNVILEAMAAGTPVVASDVAGVREILRHGETGWLVPPGDPGALAIGIQRLLEAPELAGSLAERAQSWVRANRPIDATVRAYKALYDTLLHHQEAG